MIASPLGDPRGAVGRREEHGAGLEALRLQVGELGLVDDGLRDEPVRGDVVVVVEVDARRNEPVDRSAVRQDHLDDALPELVVARARAPRERGDAEQQ